MGLTEGASAEEVQTAMIEIAPGGTLAFGEGTFSFEVDLSLDVDGVTIRGAGQDKTTLSFARQTTGAQGILVTGDAFTIQDIGIEDSPGDALKILGGDGVTIQRVRVEWTAGPKETNGAYGLYPVQCKNVLIEDSIVEGASDAGIYVGQSERIVVRNNVARNNVAGIEIENSSQADVTGNTATANTGGVLVFNLPGLQVENGHGTRVYGNEIFENNTPNFAPVGNIVGTVPTGTGIALLAAHGRRDLRQPDSRSPVDQHRDHQLRADRGAERSELRPVLDRDPHPRQPAVGDERQADRPARRALDQRARRAVGDRAVHRAGPRVGRRDRRRARRLGGGSDLRP